MKAHYSLLFALILLSACKNPDELEFGLTPATQVGANTFSCLVDGRGYQPYGHRCFGFGGGPCIDEPMYVYYKPKSGQLEISTFLTTNARAEDIEIDCDSIFAAGPAATQNAHSYHAAGIGYSTSVDKKNYGAIRSTITITHLDTVAHIISGTFEGVLKDYLLGSTQQVVITGGRFDVKYVRR